MLPVEIIGNNFKSPALLFCTVHKVVHKIKVYVNWQINSASAQEKQQQSKIFRNYQYVFKLLE